MRTTLRTFSPVAPSRPQDMGDHRRDGCRRAEAEQPGKIEHGIAERRTRQGLLRQATEHNDVGGQDRHLGELGDHQRQGELEQLARFADPGRGGKTGFDNFAAIGHDTGLFGKNRCFSEQPAKQ
jgi:hypothetical protein